MRSRRGAVACGVIGWAIGLAIDATCAYAFRAEQYRGGFGGIVVVKTLLLLVTLLWATRRGERADMAVRSGSWHNVVWLWWLQVPPSLLPFLFLSVESLLKVKG